jgi:hypothetical protein
LDSKLEDKEVCTKQVPDFNPLLVFFFWMEFWFVRVVLQMYETFHPFETFI